MRETIEILCNECLRPVGRVVDTIRTEYNGYLSYRIERIPCDCDEIEVETMRENIAHSVCNTCSICEDCDRVDRDTHEDVAQELRDLRRDAARVARRLDEQVAELIKLT